MLKIYLFHNPDNITLQKRKYRICSLEQKHFFNIKIELSHMKNEKYNKCEKEIFKNSSWGFSQYTSWLPCIGSIHIRPIRDRARNPWSLRTESEHQKRCNNSPKWSQLGYLESGSWLCPYLGCRWQQLSHSLCYWHARLYHPVIWIWLVVELGRKSNKTPLEI